MRQIITCVLFPLMRWTPKKWCCKEKDGKEEKNYRSYSILINFSFNYLN